MDIEEWELLPLEGLIEFREGGDPDKKIFHQKLIDCYHDPKGVFDTDYFRCPQSGNSYSRMPNQLVPVSIHLDQPISSNQNQEIKPEPVGKDSPVLIIERATDPDQDMVSQVFFKKMKENEFVDMKMDSPRSGSPAARGIIPQVDVGNFQDDEESENLETICSPRKKPWKQQHDVDCDGCAREEGVVAWEGSKDEFNIWKWSLNGIGALCSFGFAAATICIFIIGSSHQNKNHHQNQKLQFQIYTDDKKTNGDNYFSGSKSQRIKQVVHHATRLNEAMSAAKGSPITRAHITFGGYYEGH